MNASDSGERSSRVEREILEILERADSSQSPVENIQTALRRQRASVHAKASASSRPGWLPAAISPSIARIGSALLLAIGAALIADASRLIAVVLAIGSAVAFFSLWVPARRAGPRSSPRWRGQPLSDDDPPFNVGGRPPSWRGPRRPSR